MRLILDITRGTTANYDTIMAAGPFTSYDDLAADAGVKALVHRGGDFTLPLPAPIRGLQRVAVEAYSVDGVVNSNYQPLQQYLMVQFDGLRRVDDEVYVARNDASAAVRRSRIENGMPLPINGAPYCHRNYEHPATRMWFESDNKGGVHTVEALRVRVRGPNDEKPQFERLVLYLYCETDTDAPVRSQLPVIMNGANTENPSGWSRGVVGRQVMQGGLYR